MTDTERLDRSDPASVQGAVTAPIAGRDRHEVRAAGARRAKGWRRRRLRRIALVAVVLVAADGWLRASEATRERQTRRRLAGAA